MPLSLSKAEKAEAVLSLKRFMEESLEVEVSDLQAGFLLEYFFKELGPFAYNQGVQDSKAQLLRLAEDLSGTCFEEPLTCWKPQGSGREVRRKPGA